ncbi:MAG: peptidoglycan DD-metalloendopeptidase family protein [Bacteroidota bacterium]
MNKKTHFRFFLKPLLFFLAICFVGNLSAQTLTELEYKRKRLLAEIEATNSELKQTKANKANALQQYLKVKRKIRKRKELIATLEQEVEFIDKSIMRNTIVTESLNSDLERLRSEYAGMLRTAYRQKVNNSRWIFLLSSNSVNNAVQRWRYLKQYDDYRKKQASLIVETKTTLEIKINQLETKKQEKEALINSTNRQNGLLDRELGQKNQLLSQIKSSEAKLLLNLEAQQRKKDQMDKAIERTIVAVTKKNRVNSGTGDKSKIVKMAGQFKAMRGLLPWPVANGKIIKGFGRHEHPEYENVFTENNGVNIKAPSKAIVQAVYNGKVVGKQFIPGNQNMVIIAHGTYYTVYSNIASVSVSKGDQVKAGQTIGRLSSRNSELHFEIWKEKQRLNPERWIR